MIVVTIDSVSGPGTIELGLRLAALRSSIPDGGGPVYVRFPLLPAMPGEIASDVFTPGTMEPVGMGWSGSPRSLLTRQECAWDETWMLRNDDGTGLEQTASRRPGVAFPVGGDAGDALALAGSFGVAIVGPDAGDGSYLLCCRRTFARTPGVDLYQDELASTGSADHSVLINIHLNGDDESTAFADRCAEAAHLFAIPVAETAEVFFDRCERVEDPAVPPGSPPPGNTGPVLHAGAATAGAVRAGMSSPADRNRTVLALVAGRPATVDTSTLRSQSEAMANGTFAPLGTMAGEAALHQGELRVRTAAGRLCEVSRSGRSIIPRQRVQGYAKAGGETRYLEMRSATGIDGPSVHGVTEIASLETAGASIEVVSSTFAAEHYPAAVVRIEATISDVPRDEWIDEYSLYRVLLAEPPAPTTGTITSWYSDGSRRTWAVPTRPGWYWIGGSSFRFELGGRVVTMALLGAIAPFAVEIVADRTGRRVFVHPLLAGRAFPLARYARWHYRATLSIGEEMPPEGAAFSAPHALRDVMFPYSFQADGTISPE